MVDASEILARHTREGSLYEKTGDNSVVCFACGHRCLIREGRSGVCKVRFNRSGRLQVPWGYVGGIQTDPIEKKPFFHVRPGAAAVSFGMLGCDFHCGYCQNWLTSQTLRDPAAVSSLQEITAEQLVTLAKARNAVLTSTYNEPLITSEWAAEVFRLARETGVQTAYVSNGNGTPEVIEFLKPLVDFYKVDLKSFQDRNYRKLGGVLKNVLNSIELLHGNGFWVEIVTLVVPGFNDSDKEIREIARFVAGVSPDIPWHVTAFHKDYKMTEPDNTPAKTLLRAAGIGASEGLRFVYSGNLPGRTKNLENTYCPDCDELLVERVGFNVLQNRIQTGSCPSCGSGIPGRWEA